MSKKMRYDRNKFLSSLIFSATVTSVLLISCDNSAATNFDRIHVGFNGPKIPNVFYFENRQQVEHSWIKSALPPTEYGALISRINFKQQLLIAVAVGERSSATGEIRISHITPLSSAKVDSVDVSAMVGVADKSCEKRVSVSFPFALVLIEKLSNLPANRGFDIANFSDGCGPLKSGEANDP